MPTDKQLHQARLDILQAMQNSEPPTSSAQADYRYNVVAGMLQSHPELAKEL